MIVYTPHISNRISQLVGYFADPFKPSADTYRSDRLSPFYRDEVQVIESPFAQLFWLIGSLFSECLHLPFPVQGQLVHTLTFRQVFSYHQALKSWACTLMPMSFKTVVDKWVSYGLCTLPYGSLPLSSATSPSIGRPIISANI